MTEEHGVVVLSRLLDALDGKTVRITAETTRATDKANDKADFDRKVRESLERQTRRAQIAGG